MLNGVEPRVEQQSKSTKNFHVINRRDLAQRDALKTQDGPPCSMPPTALAVSVFTCLSRGSLVEGLPRLRLRLSPHKSSRRSKLDAGWPDHCVCVSDDSRNVSARVRKALNWVDGSRLDN
jgi:hypothetical protein